MNSYTRSRLSIIGGKLKFKLIDAGYTIKDKFRNFFENLLLKIKYSPFFSKLFSKLDNKTLLVLFITFIIFIFIQLSIFKHLFKPPDVKDIPKLKNYLASYIFEYENINRKIEAKLNNYLIEVEGFAKEISVPFHLNRIKTLQKRIKKRIKKNKDIKNFFIFNHLGRLLNCAPLQKRAININYKYTPYLKKILKTFPSMRKPVIYFYTDNELILKKYRFKKGVQIQKAKNFICEPFFPKKLLKESDEKTKSSIPENMDITFKKEKYTPAHLPYLMFFSPIFNERERFIGAAGFNIDIDELFKDILFKNNKPFHTTVINKKGIVVYSLNKLLIGRYLFYDTDIRSLLKDDKEEIIIKDKNIVFLKYKIKNIGWYIISKIDPEKTPFTYKIDPKRNMLLFVFFIFQATVFLILFSLFKRNISQPIARFSVTLKNLMRGYSMEKLKLNHNDEFKLISNRFNSLADKVRGFLIFGKTISKELVDEYLEKHPTGEIKTEEKTGTIIYLKIRNFKEIKKEITKERFDVLINKLFNDIELFVSQYKGFIDSFNSDSILAIFGIPISGYNHSQNAYECAEKIFKNLKMFNRANSSKIKISISINTGNIFYSQMLSNYGKLFVSLGDTIRNACHYESITQPHVLAVSESAMENIAPEPVMKKIVHLKLKSQKEPARVYLARL